ncbi:TerD family protein [Streptomyces uncialis]|uniref:TerD family protein n=1 Tax=Streptomyces uncialis TaxID=1048205 RepID=UPI0022566A4F|nr:TerD family protein [Streptomyces uncialis]MCX4663137.1 TerD family protein [Streptomyces uncialis]
MTAELVRGQNHPLNRTRLEIRVSVGGPVVAGATLCDDEGGVLGTEWVAHPGAPCLPGLEVPRQAAPDHRLALDLAALPDPVGRVHVLLALPPGADGPVHFGALPAPFLALSGPDGSELASYTVTGLDAESAVVALELYRRQGVWKVRAVGQGYAGGLVALLADQGLPQAAQLAAAIHEAVARPAAPVPPHASGAARLRTGATDSATAPPGPGAGPADTRPATPPAGAGASQPPADPSPPPPVRRTRPEASRPEPARPEPAPSEQVRTAGPTDPAPAGEPPHQAARTEPPGGGSIDYTHPGRTTDTPPPPAPTGPPARPGEPAGPVAGDATGWSLEERLYNQVWGMFEDLARSASAYRSAVDFADSRREQELDKALSDPRSRIGGAGDKAREAARAKYTDLVGRARAVLDRDLDQLTAEAAVVEPALPAACASWDNPVWHAYRVPLEAPMALRLGDLHLPEGDPLRIPMLVRLPLERGLWIDSGRGSDGAATAPDGERLKRLALDSAVGHTARLLAVHPPGDFAVHLIDAAGAGAAALAPLVDAGVLAAPVARGGTGVARTLGQLTRRVDLVQMALRSEAVDSLPSDIDTAQHLLIVNDFPHGFDDRAVTQLRYLADEGPDVGVHLMMVADRDDATAYGPLLDPLWRSLLRLTPVPDAHLADPWVGHTWTYEPPRIPAGSAILSEVLAQVAAGRRAWDR